MSGRGKKRAVFPEWPASELLESMSKAALTDLVVDLLRQFNDEYLNGEELAQAVLEAFEPVARCRGDRMPRMPVKRRAEAIRSAASPVRVEAAWFARHDVRAVRR